MRMNNFNLQRHTPQMKRLNRRPLRSSAIGFLAVLILFASHSFASTELASYVPPTTLKKLSLEDLMNVEVISVSKRPEKLTEAASAIQVITSEDIHRSGVSSLPEALRLAANLDVAQVSSSSWAIGARGFNNGL